MSPEQQKRAVERVVLLTRVVTEVVKTASKSCQSISTYGQRLEELLPKKRGAPEPQRG